MKRLKVAQTQTQNTDGHRDLETELAQWADSAGGKYNSRVAHIIGLCCYQTRIYVHPVGKTILSYFLLFSGYCRKDNVMRFPAIFCATIFCSMQQRGVSPSLNPLAGTAGLTSFYAPAIPTIVTILCGHIVVRLVRLGGWLYYSLLKVTVSYISVEGGTFL